MRCRSTAAWRPSCAPTELTFTVTRVRRRWPGGNRPSSEGEGRDAAAGDGLPARGARREGAAMQGGQPLPGLDNRERMAAWVCGSSQRWQGLAALAASAAHKAP